MYANPYMICSTCRQRTTHLDLTKITNQPCGHKAYMRSACISWSPVDGCLCPTHCPPLPMPLPNVKG